MQAPAIPEDRCFRFRCTLRTRWCDEDAQRVLNNAIYLTLFEEARLCYFAKLDLIGGGVFPFVLAQTNVRFLAPGRGGETVTVLVRTVRLGASSFEQAYRVVDEGGEAWAQAEALLVGWDSGTRTKCRLTDEFRMRVADLEQIAPS